MNFRAIKSWQWVLIVMALLVALDWVIRRPDARSRELNHILETQASQKLKDYPYQFQVLRVEGKTAVMTTPRNFDVPAFRVIAALFPEINVKDPNNPAFVEAQQTLAARQTEARLIVSAQPGIQGVKWELDKTWLGAHGIDMPAR